MRSGQTLLGALGLFAGLTLLPTGCTNRVDCWYATSYTQSIGEPWFALHGRTPMLMNDIGGPIFKTQAEMEAYVKAHQLTMCGAKQ